ncbi:MAG: hypothetical protein KBF19_05660 [Negativicutes bacterium]|nr:hypothetical protein [Negativicutes bacterium]
MQGLTYENLHDFIDKILIHELDWETVTRKAKIQSSFVEHAESGNEKVQNKAYFRQHNMTANCFVI